MIIVFVCFCHPGCSAFCVHHPHMTPFGGGESLTHHCNLEAGYVGRWAPNLPTVGGCVRSYAIVCSLPGFEPMTST